MPRAEVGTPKYLANKMKSKGLQRLRWYCQVCEKQCRDENGFKCHAASESHLRQMLVVGEHAGKHISNFSSEFQGEFVALLSRRFGTKRVRANQVYQEYIADKYHVHMNSTRWVTLTEFVKHLGRTGVARVDETEKGWFIAWIDSSPKALAKAEASMKKERATVSDEQRERVLIAEQIERAGKEEKEEEREKEKDEKEEGLKRDEGAEKLTISFSKPALGESSSSGPAIKMKAAVNPLKANPLKRPNVFKAASSSSSSSGAQKRSVPMTAAERLILEEQDRKRRRMERENA
ncbi:domain of Kin17 curved DNA-binding protein-domain-containing protein [Armillaria novae-zelandiae]|uniref:Domain of Kin17 curved DNA-binding protein-domain-containing protein n=1 Tax=Armillaria novae-zelandiae TaxID=153914 RepID=A0AA39UG00_9AGAR|nr:domain of Kin17 curved DNA-binding protein-domain-containing protein [Armillaria novae-zelandiae]